jgi:hypothetical protein
MPLNRERLSKLTIAEAVWRGRTATVDTVDWMQTRLRAPRWRRADLVRALTTQPDLAETKAALAAGKWRVAHAALSRHFQHENRGFVIAPSLRAALVSQITQRFPDSIERSRRRADRIIEGKYDLLGYRDLQFDGPDWHFDPVHGKRAPLVFWSQVPYLDAVCGDHKILWELNRHQHWIVLGRAHWLTGDARYRSACLAQLESWLRANPPLVGVNWASMLELAFRSLSWLWALNCFADPAIDDDKPWLVDLLLGLDRQLSHVERHLSYYFSPNTHLTGEALALYVCSRSLPELKASSRREALGRRVLRAEAARQIAGDGGHSERSTHYHRYTLDFYLLALAIARLTNDPAAHAFHDAALRLASAARLLADDRGRLPHFGDDDGGALLPLTGRPLDDIRDSLAIAAALTGRSELAVGPPPEETWWVLGHPRLASSIPQTAQPVLPTVRLRSAALPQTGYYVSRSATGDHLVIDGGPHGYLNGGHAHADALSLTFARRGQPLLIDPGTACYTVDPQLRDRFRSTDFHNTLTLDRRSQSTPRGPFSWTQTANATVHCWRTNDHFDYFVGTHDGYSPTIHRRHVLVLHDDTIVVADCVLGHGVQRASVQWHLDPAWSTRMNDRGAALFSGKDVVELAVPYGQLDRAYASTSSGLGWHSPVYGRIEPATTLRITRQGLAPLWIVSVFGLDLQNSIRTVEPMKVSGPVGALNDAIGLRLARATSVDHVLIAEPFDDTQRSALTLGEISTDARMLLLRFDRARLSAALVDATTVRAGYGSALALTSPSPIADMHLDRPLPKGVFSCAVSPDF